MFDTRLTLKYLFVLNSSFSFEFSTSKSFRTQSQYWRNKFVCLNVESRDHKKKRGVIRKAK